ncbi:EAL domain-containing protein, partial [Paucibacter sp. O1-1]|nr:EAL domain-containing protein [Paucibacter sp. O1-1]MDA3830087.1 EAL domain-containing protein [Paucibacter sp. O1-1]
MQQAAAWRSTGLEPAGVGQCLGAAVPAGRLHRSGWVHALREHELPGELLELELTESLAGARRRRARWRACPQLSALGVRMAIDDFGTGYSSAGLPEALPDRPRSRSTAASSRPCRPTRAMPPSCAPSCRWPRRWASTVIAEGVETEPQRMFLTDAGCDEFQGFLTSRAVAPD